MRVGGNQMDSNSDQNSFDADLDTQSDQIQQKMKEFRGNTQLLLNLI